MEKIQHILYINLDTRPDRKQHIEQQFALLGVDVNKVERFPAIKLQNGRIGCSMSHLQCLQLAKDRGYENVMILEDDITFLDPTLFQQQFKKFTHYVPNYDVVILAGNNVPPYRPMISPEDGKAFAIQVTHCQTTTGYLVKSLSLIHI